MPIYEYKCLKCGKEHEVVQKFSDDPLSVCSACGGELKKQISSTSFVLKGTGWYATDYASKGNKRQEKAKSKKEEKKESKQEPVSKTGDSGKKTEPVS